MNRDYSELLKEKKEAAAAVAGVTGQLEEQERGSGGGGGPGQAGRCRTWPGRAALLHLPAALVLTDIFPTAPCHSGIIAHDYGEDQHDRLSLISLTSVGEVIQAVTRIAPDMKSS